MAKKIELIRTVRRLKARLATSRRVNLHLAAMNAKLARENLIMREKANA